MTIVDKTEKAKAVNFLRLILTIYECNTFEIFSPIKVSCLTKNDFKGRNIVPFAMG